jgi:ABC-2 type transport system permease protein
VAGLAEFGAVAPVATRTQLKAIAWLRWRLFVRTFNKSGAGNVVLWLLVLPFGSLIYLAALAGPLFLTYSNVSGGGSDLTSHLEMLLWGIALLAVMLPLLSSAAAPPFEFATLIRFPFRYRGYLALRVVYSLIDQPTILLTLAMLGIFLGAAFANQAFALHALPTLVFFGLSCFLFVRMLLVWMDRWLAQRRSREILGFFAFLFGLSMQFGLRVAHDGISRLQALKLAHPATAPYVYALRLVTRILPPTLTARAMTANSFSTAAICTLAIAAFAGIFFILFDHRLRAEYHGENLSEASARTVHAPQAARTIATVPTVVPAKNATVNHAWLPAATLAVLAAESKLLFRGNAKLQQLIAPVLIAIFLTLRSHSTHSAHSATIGWMTVIGYLLFLISNSMMNNVLGAEGFGLQLYFLAPVRLRDVFLGKNLMTLAVGCVEFVAVYAAMTIMGARPSTHSVILSLAWLAYAVPTSFCLGNLMSLYMPRRFDPGAVRRRAAAGGAFWITIFALPLLAGVGVGVYWLARIVAMPWIAYLLFAVFAVAGLASYAITLARLDTIALRRREQLSEAICKSA